MVTPYWHTCNQEEIQMHTKNYHIVPEETAAPFCDLKLYFNPAPKPLMRHRIVCCQATTSAQLKRSDSLKKE